MSKEYAHQARMAQERFDVLEVLPRKGCNAKRGGKHCGRLIVYTRPGPLGMRRLCDEHVIAYETHDRMLARISILPPHAID